MSCSCSKNFSGSTFLTVLCLDCTDFFSPTTYHLVTSLVAQTVKPLPTMGETQVWSLDQEDLLEKEMATHSSIAWKIPWTEEPLRLQSMGSQRVGHNWATSHSLISLTKIFKWFKFILLKCSWFTMLCYFLLYSKVIHTLIYLFFHYGLSSVQFSSVAQ